MKASPKLEDFDRDGHNLLTDEASRLGLVLPEISRERTIQVHPEDYRPIFKSDDVDWNGSHDVGDLDNLPVEVLHTMLGHLDLLSMSRLYQASHGTKRLVFSLPYVRHLDQKFMKTLCLYKLVEQFSVNQLVSTMKSEECACCAEHSRDGGEVTIVPHEGATARIGTNIFLPSMERACVPCLRECPRFLMMTTEFANECYDIVTTPEPGPSQRAAPTTKEHSTEKILALKKAQELTSLSGVIVSVGLTKMLNCSIKLLGSFTALKERLYSKFGIPEWQLSLREGSDKEEQSEATREQLSRYLSNQVKASESVRGQSTEGRLSQSELVWFRFLESGFKYPCCAESTGLDYLLINRQVWLDGYMIDVFNPRRPLLTFDGLQWKRHYWCWGCWSIIDGKMQNPGYRVHGDHFDDDPRRSIQSLQQEKCAVLQAYHAEDVINHQKNCDKAREAHKHIKLLKEEVDKTKTMLELLSHIDRDECSIHRLVDAALSPLFSKDNSWIRWT